MEHAHRPARAAAAPELPAVAPTATPQDTLGNSAIAAQLSAESSAPTEAPGIHTVTSPGLPPPTPPSPRDAATDEPTGADAEDVSGYQRPGRRPARPTPVPAPTPQAPASTQPYGPADLPHTDSDALGEIVRVLNRCVGDHPDPARAGEVVAALEAASSVARDGLVHVRFRDADWALTESDHTEALVYARNMHRQAAEQADPRVRSARTEARAHDLGEQSSIGGFCRASGTLIDAAVPDDDASLQLSIAANLPLGQTGVSVGLMFSIGASREGGRVTLRTQLGARLLGQVDAWFVHAWASAEVHGYIEANGNNGHECMSMLMYAIHERVAAASPELAGRMFDARFVSTTARGIGRDDYVESGMGGSVAAGVGLGAPTEPEGEFGARAGVDSGTRIRRGDNGLEHHGSRTVQVGASAAHPPFALDGTASAHWLDGTLDEVKLEVKDSAELGLEHLARFVGPVFLGEFAGVLQDMITRTGGAYAVRAGEDAGRHYSGLGSVVGRLSGASFGGAEALAHQLSEHATENDLGGSVSYNLRVTLGWSRSDGMKADVVLARTSAFRVGANDRVRGIALALESTQRILAAHVTS